MLFFLVLPIALTLATGLASAQTPVVTPPYETMRAAVPTAADAGATQAFETLRAVIAAKDEARLAAMLRADFMALSCSPDPTALCAPGRAPATSKAKAPPLERLRLALCCSGRDDPTVASAARTEALFGLLGSLLAAGAPAEATDMPGAICSPALPALDKAKAKALVRKLDLDPAALRRAEQPLQARTKPDRTLAVAITLPAGTIVPLVTGASVTVPDGWTALALPSGGIGYAEGATLEELAPEALCMRRDKTGWQIAFLIGRQS